MRCRSLLSAAHLLCVCATALAARGSRFLVTAPGIIRPGAKLTVGVELLKHGPLQITVKAQVLKKASNRTETVLEAEGVFKRGFFKLLTLPSLPLDSADEIYELLVTGQTPDEILFSNSTRLSFETKRMSVLIQTDKALYKPNQEVKFRVLTLFSDFKPLKTPLNIFIKDPKSNLIQQWFFQQGDLGVVSKTFQLSSNPILGDWSIQVQVNDQQYYQSFEVSEYVLPKFEVTLQTPLYCSLKAKNLSGNVIAKYTYGKPVRGIVTLTFFSLSFWGAKKNITKSFEINGSTNFSFSNKEMKKVMGFSDGHHVHIDPVIPGPIEIVATVTESLTGISRNASANVFFKQYDYIIEFFDYVTVLKPSLNFTATVKVSRSDGNALTQEETRNNLVLEVTHREHTDLLSRWNSQEQEMDTIQMINYTVPPNGVFKIEFPVLYNTSELLLTASFLDSVSNMVIHGTFTSPSLTFIQLKTRDEHIKVGSPFELVVSGNRYFNELSYMVVSKGQLVAVGKQNSKTFSLIPEASWAPKACIIVYYVADDGEIINDVLKIPVQFVFKNKIKLFWSKPSVKPSEKVSLGISVTETDSIVGIVAIDKSVNLMNASSDITMENVVHELELYNTGYYLGMFMNSFAVFQECGLWVLTDAKLVKDNIDGVYDTAEYFDRSAEENEGNWIGFQDFSLVSNPHVRKHFPETWIWLDSYMGSKVYQDFEVTVPDSITSWVASAFVISKDLGLGLTTAPAELQVFKPFFIDLNLPYSIIRGEEFALEVIIFNYLESTTKVIVLIEENDTSGIIMSSNDANDTTYQQTALVPSEDGVTLLFPIKPTQLGEIPITVKAASSTATDVITRKILVKAEGIEKSYSQSVLLDLTENQAQIMQKTLNFSFPPDTVKGSERVQITAIGDILGPSINGLGSLIRMPYGCGEQNMINFAPNIYILDYLTKQKQLTDNLKEKALSFLRQGYQRELLYQREDGSFSAFGDSDPSGSTWLSAFVLRCFMEADFYIDIDQNVLQRTYNWLKEHRKPNGEFWEPGRVIHSELQGGNKSPVTLTAYIMTSLLGYRKYQPVIDIQPSIKFLESEFDRGITDNYTLALVAYALFSVGSPKAEDALYLLTQQAEKKGDMQFWLSSAPTFSQSWQPRSLDIEVAAYALLSHLQHRVSEGIPVMRWLSRQRNSLGGFASTQDTVVALKALSEFSALMHTENTNIQVTVTGPSSPKPIHFRIDTQNRFLLHTAKLAVLALEPTVIRITAQGFGFVICQLNVVYNVKSSDSLRRARSIKNREAFDLDVDVKDEDDANHVNLNVCTRFLGQNKTGMALMEVNLLSGFTVPSGTIPLSEMVKKVEYDHGKVNLYLDSVNETQFCVDVPAVRNFRVSKTQDASVSIVDYYEPRRQAVRSYNTKVKLSSCDLCGDNSCYLCMNGAMDSLRPSSSLFASCFSLLYLVRHWL
ncbi:CD109 antigen isoform X1 [Cricetulus griseus]|uniref:CD109 antigen n=2 Tax=Cricetulus griseus TaxID=10029 RepID=G3HH37_CRIGR|nr:CD109 antigen isoform X1 [Cricetulus griseus]XP_027266878.1 CD109 antigen isoform X1 [Cricetulus griseus]EGW06594.1 CD109 antigen [Cricetulus griseus]